MFKLAALSTIGFGAQFESANLFGDSQEGANFAGAMHKSWFDGFTEMKSDIFSQVAIKKWVDDFGEAYEMMVQTDSYKRKMKKKHQQKGAFRSGEGTPDQIYQRLKLFEEEEELDKLQEEGISPQDHRKAEKLFQR